MSMPSHRHDIPGYEVLEDLALDFFSMWNQNHLADKIWQELDPGLWDLLRNPWVVLQTVSREKLEKKLAEPSFRKLVEDLYRSQKDEEASPSWFQKTYANEPLKCIAYFSMEFMLGESLPIYSGGLGNVAGDQLKAASDLGVPVIGVGLLYQQGYFRQTIDKDGNQHALYPYNDPGQLPIKPLRKADGEWMRLEVRLPGWSVWVRAWEVKVGRAKLFLLDTNDAVNYPVHRGITSELYGGDLELRIKQELILGIGGTHLLDLLGIKADVFHLNEGHAAFLILERAKDFMKEQNVDFEIAFAATRAGNHFTTHTAVPAGFDRFPPSLIDQFLGKYARDKLGISLEQLLALGRQNPKDNNEPFNMAFLAARGSGSVNGVSMLHSKVSRRLCAPLFPRWPEEEIPIGHVTNGVHMPSWGSVNALNLWAQYSGKACWLGKEAEASDIRNIPDAQLWQMRNEGRKAMVEYTRSRLSRIWEARGFPEEEVERARRIFDPNTLTLGFARRFATYKRPNMLLYDTERLLRILTNPQRPVQLLISGKAHPADKPGQELIKQWIQIFFSGPEARSHIIFLADYDMQVTSYFARGVDLWINTPRRPWEACGTSGMKLLVNGGINLSELDGWWAEAYSPEVGWALGDFQEHGDDPAWDAAEANHLYDLLEKEVIPEFYIRDERGIPKKWVARIRESMARLTPQFSADRCVREYTEKYYLPRARSLQKRIADKASHAKKIVEWKHKIEANWPAIRFAETKIDSNKDVHIFEIQVYLNDLNPDFVAVELYALGLEGGPSERIEMKRIRELEGTPGMYIYQVSVPAKRPANSYTARIIPKFEDVAVPSEIGEIIWQK